MSSYTEKYIIPFGDLVLLNIPIEEIHERFRAGVLVVKELWLKPRQCLYEIRSKDLYNEIQQNHDLRNHFDFSNQKPTHPSSPTRISGLPSNLKMSDHTGVRRTKAQTVQHFFFQ